MKEKPDFNKVYPYVKKFFQPFIEQNKTNLIWNYKNMNWDKEREKKTSKNISKTMTLDSFKKEIQKRRENNQKTSFAKESKTQSRVSQKQDIEK